MRNTRPAHARQGFTKVGNDEFSHLDPYSYRIIINLRGHTPEFVASYRLIAAQTNMSIKTVKRRLEYLEGEGLIVRAGGGRNRTVKWAVNNISVGTERPHKWGLGDPTKKNNGGIKVKPKPKAKSPPSVADWNRAPSGAPPASVHPIRPRLNPADINAAKLIERFFWEPGKKDARIFRLNYEEFNYAVREMRDKYGRDAHVEALTWMSEHYPQGLPFHRKNWRILMAKIWPPTKQASGG